MPFLTRESKCTIGFKREIVTTGAHKMSVTSSGARASNFIGVISYDISCSTHYAYTKILQLFVTYHGNAAQLATQNQK